RFYRHVEFGIFSRKLRVRVILGKRDLHHARFADPNTDELIFEPRQEGPASDIDADIAATTPFERSAVNPASEIDNDAVAFFGLCSLGFGRKRPALFRDPLDRFVELRVGDLRYLPFELHSLKVR